MKHTVNDKEQTASGSTHEIDCINFGNIVNLHLHITHSAPTITIVNATKCTKLSIMEMRDVASATVTYGSGFKLGSNNSTPITALNDQNNYQFMGDLTGGGVHQMSPLTTIPA